MRTAQRYLLRSSIGGDALIFNDNLPLIGVAPTVLTSKTSVVSIYDTSSGPLYSEDAQDLSTAGFSISSLLAMPRQCVLDRQIGN